MVIFNNIKLRYFEMVKLSVYCMISIVIIILMIIKMYVYIKFLIVIGRLFDEEIERVWFLMFRK